MITITILKNVRIPVSFGRILDFLVPFRLTDLTQDIVVRQFDSNAFIKAYIVGVSVWYQTLYVVCDSRYANPNFGSIKLKASLSKMQFFCQSTNSETRRQQNNN